ncbi:MAG: PrpF domain-containing protein, partial [bacterium]
QPAVPKVGFITKPASYRDIEGGDTKAEDMDLCARVISVFKCHKACPLTSASSISVAAFLDGSIVQKVLGVPAAGQTTVRIGHPSGVMTMVPTVEKEGEEVRVPGVAVQRTARRIMDGYVYVRN